MITKLYIIEWGKFSKIGISKNPLERIKDINNGLPTFSNLKYIKSFGEKSEAKKAEDQLMKMFAHKRARGEWFAINYEEILRKAKDLFGNTEELPEEVTLENNFKSFVQNRQKELKDYLTYKDSQTLPNELAEDLLKFENKNMIYDKFFEKIFHKDPYDLSDTMKIRIEHLRNKNLEKNSSFIYTNYFLEILNLIHYIDEWSLYDLLTLYELRKDDLAKLRLSDDKQVYKELFNEIINKYPTEGAETVLLSYECLKEYAFNMTFETQSDKINSPPAFEFGFYDRPGGGGFINIYLFDEKWLNMMSQLGKKNYNIIFDKTPYLILAEIIDSYGWNVKFKYLNKDPDKPIIEEIYDLSAPYIEEIKMKVIDGLNEDEITKIQRE